MIIIPATIINFANQKIPVLESTPFEKGSQSYGFCKDVLDITTAWKTKFDVELKNEHSSYCFLLHFPSNKMLSLEVDDYSSGPIDHPNSVWIEFNINSFEDSTQNSITLNAAYKQLQVSKEELIRVDDIDYKPKQTVYITYSNKQISLYLTSFLTSNPIFTVYIDLSNKLNSNICWCGFCNINKDNNNNNNNNNEISNTEENELNCKISHWIMKYFPSDLVVSDSKLSFVDKIIPPILSSSLTLFCTAKLDSGNVCMINKKQNSVSAAYCNKKINLARNWEISFMYELTGSADGFTFIMQSNSPSIPKGTGKMLGCQGITNAIILEFDLYCNSDVNDPSCPHVALFGYGSTSAQMKHKTDAEIGKFKTAKIDGKQVVKITYDGVKMVVKITDIKTNDTTELVSTIVNLDKYLKSEEAYIGFTASTGEKYMSLTINALEFCCTESDINMRESSHNLIVLLLLIELSLARVTPDKRKFVSNAVDNAVKELKSKMKDAALAEIFENAYPNTLDTTIYSFKYSNRSTTGKTDTFVVTGDIHAMWLRDSCNQVLPYFRFVNEDLQLKEMLKGVLNRQIYSVKLDPYANAFNYDSTGHPDSHKSDSTTKPDYLDSKTNAMINEIFERKYEIDSLAAMLKLSYAYYINTKDLSPFDSDWIDAVNNIIEVIKDMQKETTPGVRFNYFFQRESTQPTESLQNGFGFPGKKTNLSRSSFRPSDDACTFPYFIPGNAMMVVELRHASRDDLSNTVLQLANEIEAAIYQYGIRKDPDFGEILTYEVNGYGSDYFMDDANIPSLLSLPYLGFINYNDSLYQRTRKAVLSVKNPYYFKDSGSDVEGTGGPHNGLGWIWPMSIIIRIMTTDDKAEIMRCLEMLKVSAVNNYIHESFWFNNPGSITRPWFAWANSLFGEMIFDLADRHPNLILK